MTFIQKGLYRARAKTQERQEIQGKRKIPNGDKLSLYSAEYLENLLIRHISCGLT